LSTPSANTLLIAPIQEQDPSLIEEIRTEIHRVYGFSTEIKALLDDIGFAYDEERHQYYSTPILHELASLAPPNILKVLAITKEDLFIPILTHVYGEAQLGGRACIVSTCRLSRGTTAAWLKAASHKRVAKEAVHELGHTFKLRHCRDQSCIMHYCRTIKDVDRKSDDLCRYCKVLLEDEFERLGLTGGIPPAP
jgi:archaemetzincin